VAAGTVPVTGGLGPQEKRVPIQGPLGVPGEKDREVLCQVSSANPATESIWLSGSEHCAGPLGTLSTAQQ
jgi:hypothetical protein